MRLAPALQQSSRDPKARAVLLQSLAHLNAALRETGAFLTGPQVTAADIGIWVLVALEDTLKGASEVGNIKEWFERVLALPVVQSTIADYPLSELSLAGLQQSNNFGGFSHITLDAERSPTRSVAFSTQSSESPSIAAADTVTPEELQLVVDHFVYTKPVVEKEPRTV